MAGSVVAVVLVLTAVPVVDSTVATSTKSPKPVMGALPTLILSCLISNCTVTLTLRTPHSPMVMVCRVLAWSSLSHKSTVAATVADIRVSSRDSQRTALS